MIKVKIILNKKIQLGLCQIANMYSCTTEKPSISSVPFKLKNRDKIDLDARNPNLKKSSDRDFRATAQPKNYHVGL